MGYMHPSLFVLSTAAPRVRYPTQSSSTQSAAVLPPPPPLSLSSTTKNSREANFGLSFRFQTLHMDRRPSGEEEEEDVSRE